MKHCYYSVFGRDYAYKGLLLYQSIKKWDPDFHLYIFYIHEEVKELFEKLRLKDATLISLSEVDPPFSDSAKMDGAATEDIRMAKAGACFYLLKRFPEIDHLVWLDGNSFFTPARSRSSRNGA